MATRLVRRAFWFSTATFGVGVALFLYGQALAAFALPECPRFAFEASGNCGWAYRFDVGGIALALCGILGHALLLVRVLWRRRS